MSLLILQTQAPDHSLAADSYGVIATAAMLDQSVSVVYCNEGVKQLSVPELRQQLQTAIEFGVKNIYLISADCEHYQVKPQPLSEQVDFVSVTSITELLNTHDQILTY